MNKNDDDEPGTSMNSKLTRGLSLGTDPLGEVGAALGVLCLQLELVGRVGLQARGRGGQGQTLVHESGLPFHAGLHGEGL